MSEEDPKTVPAEKPEEPEHEDSSEEITESERKELILEVEKPSEADLNQDEIEKAREILQKDNGVFIEVNNPTLKKGGAFSKDYYAYDISGKFKDKEIKVCRRFKEFNALRTRLKANWPGIFIPALPEKNIANNNKRIIFEREMFLNHFMKKCAKIDHIFESEEMQIFLFSTGTSDQLIKTLENMEKKSPIQIYIKYKELFPEYDQKSGMALDIEVKKKIATLKEPIDNVRKMRNTLKSMNQDRPTLKKTNTDFSRYISKEAYKNIKDAEEKKKVEKKFEDYVAQEFQNDIQPILSSLKILLRDLEAFLTIDTDLKAVLNTIATSQKAIFELEKELTSLNSSTKEKVSDGLFKMKNKGDKIAELENNLKNQKILFETSQKLLDLVNQMIQKREIPLILFVKNMGLANGFAELAKKRRDSILGEKTILESFDKYIGVEAPTASA